MASVVCTGADEIPDGWLEAQADEWAKAELKGSPPATVRSGCGREIDFDLDDPWDIKTDENGKTVSRHRDVICPFCGASNFVQEADYARS